MKNQTVIRDERTIAVENSSYRLAYTVMSFGLLLIVAYRGFVWQEANWDLMALVILGGGIATLYQGSHKVLSPRWSVSVVLTMVMAAIVAVIWVLIF
ncbi:MAG: hypothetical protein H6658_21150 [Ardenticatenaceae bacterium]|nr:hypothetical protein [Ardenticatenaceae bacterium]